MSDVSQAGGGAGQVTKYVYDENNELVDIVETGARMDTCEHDEKNASFGSRSPTAE